MVTWPSGKARVCKTLIRGFDSRRHLLNIMNQLNKKEIKSKFKKSSRPWEIVLILENIQYATNVASIFRTADAAGVSKVFLTGITKTPPFGKDLRKTSRSKEKSVNWSFREDTSKQIKILKEKGYFIVAIELADSGVPNLKLTEFINGKSKVAFIAGSEVYGLSKKALGDCDISTYVPMYGKGASLNVAASVAITLFSF